MTEPVPLFARRFATPLGPMVVVVTADGSVRRLAYLSDQPVERLLAAVAGPGGPAIRYDPVGRPGQAAARVERQVVEYGRGQRLRFDLPLAPIGTPFQRRVWDELVRIPYGETRSYGELAACIGRPGAARAVGRANATNPVCIVVPCHRLVGRDGALTGFLGGLELKRDLLALERRTRRS